MRNVVASGWVGLTGAAILSAWGCAASPSFSSASGPSTPAAGPRRDTADSSTGGPAIGLRRGYAWSTLTVHPPNITGPNTSMLLKEGVLSGSIGGLPLSVRIEPDGADGFGPTGPVSLNFKDDTGAVEVAGSWNGQRVHFSFTEDSLRGTVSNSGGSSALSVHGFDGTGFDPQPHYGLPVTPTCEYTLSELGKDGALSGTSTCSGMPEPTRLEVSRLVRAYMTRPELLVVLVALLSTPPIVGSESISSPS